MTIQPNKLAAMGSTLIEEAILHFLFEKRQDGNKTGVGAATIRQGIGIYRGKRMNEGIINNFLDKLSDRKLVEKAKKNPKETNPTGWRLTDECYQSMKDFQYSS